MSLTYPPYYSKVTRGQKLTQPWQNFWYLVWLHLEGEAQLEEDKLGGSSLELTDFQINDFTWSEPSANQILQKSDTSTISWIDRPTVVDTPPSGTVELTVLTTAPSGWLLMDDGTIGNAASGGTTRANADTEDLFTALWDSTADAQCPVSSGRGASAAADFAANKTITLPAALGKLMAGVGSGSGLTARVMAETAGEDDHTIDKLDMPAHTHTIYGDDATTSSERQVVRYASDTGAGAADKTMNTLITDADISGETTLPNNPQSTFSLQQPSTNFNIIIRL